MRPSYHLSDPVITFFTASPTASVRAIEKLRAWTQSSPTDLPTAKPRVETASGLNHSWEFCSYKCPHSKTILQCMAIANGTTTTGRINLLAVQESPNDDLEALRKSLFHELQPTTSAVKLCLQRWFRRTVDVSTLLGSQQLPVLNVVSSNEQTTMNKDARHGQFKELVIPVFHDALYGNGDTVVSRLSSLARPVTGLYQLNNGVCLRPLPTSAYDTTLPPASLVFHSTNNSFDACDETITAKIGFNGTGTTGQIVLGHAATAGLDVRYCSNSVKSSMFCEAQESMLAASLQELQSTRVVGDTASDPRTNQADCWAEFRANLARPLGYLKTRTVTNIAKAPNLPFE
jgi:hypothetical protein